MEASVRGDPAMRRLILPALICALTLGSGCAPAAQERPAPSEARAAPTDGGLPAAGAFSPTGWLREAREDHTATRLPDGRVLVVAGGGDGLALDSAEVWDPATGTFGPAGSLGEVRTGHTATLLPDGRVLVVGGTTMYKFLASAEIWDPATGTFSPTGSLQEERYLHTATLLPDGRVLVVGGRRHRDRLASAEIWDPASGTFSPTGSLQDAREEHTATLLPDGRVLVAGGCCDTFLGISGLTSVRASAEIWDPSTGTFQRTGSLTESRIRHTATLLPDGRVLVIGGKDGWEPLASAEAWDPATGTFSPTGSLQEERYGHTATLLPDGRVLVVGGHRDLDSRNTLNSAEIWDPASRTSRQAGSLTVARAGHTATLLPDGRVLVIGGEVKYPVLLASAEVWDPRGGDGQRISVGSPVAGQPASPSRSGGTVAPGPPYPVDGVHVYDQAGVLREDTIAAAEAAATRFQEWAGAPLIVYTQVRPTSDTYEETLSDARALLEKWDMGRGGSPDGLVILFDLASSSTSLCDWRVQLYARGAVSSSYFADADLQAICDEAMDPALRECDFDGALMAALERIGAASIEPVVMPGM
jgi:WD40 repeat protein